MTLDRQQIKQNAKDALKANYWPMIGYFVLNMVICAVCGGLSSLYVGLILTILVVPVVAVSFCYLTYKVYRNEEHSVSGLFDGFQNFGHVLGGYWWMYLFILLWSMLFYIPGIVKAIAYSMTPYILMDQPEVGAKEALKLSMEMTKGHKMEIFVMYLSFIGWAIVSAITLNIAGIFYVYPYMQLTMAGYYDELKKQQNPVTYTA